MPIYCQIKTPPGKNVCFAKAFLLGMAQLCTARTIYNSYRNKDTLVWANQAIELHTHLNPWVDECITWQQMEQAADHFEVNIHIFDTSNIKPEFSFHYPQSPVYAKHLYFLQDGSHFHYISNINGVINVFKRKVTMTFCELCYKIYDTRYIGPEGHVCRTGDEVREPIRP